MKVSINDNGLKLLTPLARCTYSTDYVVSQGYGVMHTCLLIGLGGLDANVLGEGKRNMLVLSSVLDSMSSTAATRRSLVSDTVNNILAAQVDNMCEATDE